MKPKILKIGKNYMEVFSNMIISKKIHTVVMIRHGESVWNVENRFTGWCDVPLTSSGEADGKDAGLLLKNRGLKFDVAFTSNLERAWRTCALVLSWSGQSHIEVVRSWKLNERHYGLLQGHKKNSRELSEAFGDAQVMEWRKSYGTPPPSIDDAAAMSKLGREALMTSTSWMNPKYLETSPYLNQLELQSQTNNVNNNSNNTDYNFLDVPSSSEFPKTESLKQCEIRAFGYWKEV